MIRRNFLSTAAAGTFWAAAGGVADERAPVRKSVNAGRIFKALKAPKELSSEELTAIKALGFDGIEGRPGTIKDFPAYRDRLAEAGLAMHGMVGSLHWKQRLSDPEPKVRAIGLEALLEGIRQSRVLGGSSVLLVVGRVDKNATHEEVWSRSITEIRKAIPEASKRGIRILVETVWNGFCEDPTQFRDYLDEIGSPWVGAYFDIGNMQKFAPAEEWIRVLGTRTVKLDVKDWGEKHGFCPLGEGEVNWANVREAIAETGFTGWATREGQDGGNEKTARLMDELLDL